MKTRHTPKTASCLYMLGFASGLLFIVLCGGSTIYEEFAASIPQRNADARSANVIEAALPVAQVAENDAPVPLSQTVGGLNLDYTRSDAGDRLSVIGLGFEPGERVVVSVMSGENLVASQEARAADEVGSINLDIVLPTEARSLTSIEVIATSKTNTVSASYTLPGDISIGTGDSADGVSSGEPTMTTDRPVCTNTPIPLPPSPPSTSLPTPTITPTPMPTPVILEPYYPNWRAEYFNNPTWQGEPTQIRDDPVIAFDWGEDSPAPGAIGQNWFSVRWTRRISLPEGYYDFVLSADDQARSPDEWSQDTLLCGQRYLVQPRIDLRSRPGAGRICRIVFRVLG